jgi:hypothetical protein
MRFYSIHSVHKGRSLNLDVCLKRHDFSFGESRIFERAGGSEIRTLSLFDVSAKLKVSGYGWN